LLAAVGADLCGAYDRVSAVAPVVNWTWARDQDKGEAAAAPAPEMDFAQALVRLNIDILAREARLAARLPA
jgi:hypothetical protein